MLIKRTVFCVSLYYIMVKDWCNAIFAVVWVHFPLQRNAWCVELLFDG